MTKKTISPGAVDEFGVSRPQPAVELREFHRFRVFDDLDKVFRVEQYLHNCHCTRWQTARVTRTNQQVIVVHSHKAQSTLAESTRLSGRLWSLGRIALFDWVSCWMTK